MPGGCKTLFPELCIPFRDTCFWRFPHSVCAFKWWKYYHFQNLKSLHPHSLCKTFQLRVFHRYLVCIMVSSKKHLMKSGINAALRYARKNPTAQFFFLSGFSFTDTDDSQYSRKREWNIIYSTLPLPHAHEHWNIYLQFCMWDDYHIFLIATLVFTRLLLLDEIYHLIELSFDRWYNVCVFVCLPDELILRFCYSDLTWETNGFKLASTITVVLQANRLTKCASHGSKSERWWWHYDCFLPNYKSASLKCKSEVVYIFIPNIWLNLFIKTQDIKLYLDKYQT